MPFGLKNADATFVLAVRSMLRPIHYFADLYVDDIGVGSQDWESHVCQFSGYDRRICRFLSIVSEAGMTLNLVKCEFGKPKVKFVGRMDGSGNHRPDPQRLQGLAKIEVPLTKKAESFVGSFLLQKVYPSFLSHCHAPHQSDKKGCAQCDCIALVRGLQTNLRSPEGRTIVHANVANPHHCKTPFQMHTDASGKAVGATLGQLDEQGVERPLAFASQKLSDTQMGWSTIEREAYAVICALNRFRDLIFGSRVSIFCDHIPLQYIRECAPRASNSFDGHWLSKSLIWTFITKKNHTM